MHHFGILKASSKPKDRRNSSRKETGRRSKDKRQLSSSEKKMQKHAHSLIKKGMFIEGANILEGIGDFRSAVSTLESNGMPVEASNILIRMGIANRAGALLARNGRWQEAAEAFVTAKLDIEAAKCYFNANQYENSAKLFALSGHSEAAGDSFYKAGKYKEAIELYIKGDKVDKAVKALKRVLSDPSRTAEKLDHINMKKILDEAAKSGNLDADLVEYLQFDDLTFVAIDKMLQAGKSSEIAEYLKAKDKDFYLKLIQNISDDNSTNRFLAQAFEIIKAWLEAGMVHKRIDQFEHAGKCFEKAGDNSRAAYCYERAGKKAKATELRKGTGEAKSENPKENSGGFSLGDDMATKVLPTSDVEESTLDEQSPNRFSLNEASVTASRLDSIGKSILPANTKNDLFDGLADEDLHLFASILNCFESKKDEDLTYKLKHQFLLIFKGDFYLEKNGASVPLKRGAFLGNTPGCVKRFDENYTLTSTSNGFYGTISLESLDTLMETKPILACTILKKQISQLVLLEDGTQDQILSTAS